jgi:hypothetical protein
MDPYPELSHAHPRVGAEAELLTGIQTAHHRDADTGSSREGEKKRSARNDFFVLNLGMPNADCRAEINTISSTALIFRGRSGRNRALLRDTTPLSYSPPATENLKLDCERLGHSGRETRGRCGGERWWQRCVRVESHQRRQGWVWESKAASPASASDNGKSEEH